MNSHEQLKGELHAAVRGSLAAVIAAHPHEELLGFGLVTDDDLVTISHVAATRESLAVSSNRDARWIAVEWRHSEGFALLDRARQLFVADYEARRQSDFDGHVHDCFELLVEALSGVRADGLVGEDVLLVVESGDPGPWHEAASATAARRLNPPVLVEGYRAALGR